MRALDFSSLPEVPEKDALSTANQSKIIATSPHLKEVKGIAYEANTGDNDDAVSIVSLFGKTIHHEGCETCKTQAQLQKSATFAFENSKSLHSLLYPHSTDSPGSDEGMGKQLRLLIPVMQSIFLGYVLPPLDGLTLPQIRILVVILRRKLGRKDQTLEKRHEEFQEEVRSIQEKLCSFSVKRTEENNKFVFKQIIKIIGRYVNTPSLPLEKTECSIIKCEFNRTKAVSSPPKQERKKRKLKNISSLSLGALKDILKDDELKQDFRRTLLEPCLEKSEFVQTYFGSLKLKITKLFQRWEKQFEKQSSTSEVYTKMLNYFLKNNQCKLPWTYYEVFKAVNCFLESIGWSAQVTA